MKKYILSEIEKQYLNHIDKCLACKTEKCIECNRIISDHSHKEIKQCYSKFRAIMTLNGRIE